jgi:DNA-binding LytR/AlgR family response regulator
MKVLIIEDERPAASRLERMLKAYDPGIEVLAMLDSVKQSVKWLTTPEHKPELIFMDIQLADGLSFEIFEYTDIRVPVIFTTAYDEYALKAFKVNSVDYLLKPIDEEELARSFDKLDRLREGSQEKEVMLQQIQDAMAMLNTRYKSRFMIRIGEHIKTVDVGEILYFFSRNKATFCCIGDNRTYLLDHSLEQVEAMVDPQRFFRINRQYHIALDAILDIISYSNSRLRIILKSCSDNDVIVSRDRVNEFKEWLDR